MPRWLISLSSCLTLSTFYFISHMIFCHFLTHTISIIHVPIMLCPTYFLGISYLFVSHQPCVFCTVLFNLFFAKLCLACLHAISLTSSRRGPHVLVHTLHCVATRYSLLYQTRVSRRSPISHCIPHMCRANYEHVPDPRRRVTLAPFFLISRLHVRHVDMSQFRHRMSHFKLV